MKLSILKPIGFALLFTLIHSKIIGQVKFEIFGTANTIYNDASINILGKFYKKENFSSISTKVKNGKFYLSERLISLYQKIYFSISVNGKTHNLDFFIKKGKQSIVINYVSEHDSLNNIILVNAPFQKIQADFKYFIKPCIDSNKKFDDLYNLQIRTANKPFIDSLRKIKTNNIKKLLDEKIKFIVLNSNSYFSLHEFATSIITTSTLYSADELYNVFLGFSQKLKNTSLGREVFEILMKKKALVLNREIINFSFKSNTLNNYSLSQFSNNKYILLCFWASWCAPCKKNIPLLKDISKRYSEKGLQIISISIDDDKKKWLTALKNFEMPGIQTCDIKEFINEKETIRNRYYIHAIPQYFLIDKKGIIIYHNLQMKDTDYTSLVKTLKEIFKE